MCCCSLVWTFIITPSSVAVRSSSKSVLLPDYWARAIPFSLFNCSLACSRLLLAGWNSFEPLFGTTFSQSDDWFILTKWLLSHVLPELLFSVWEILLDFRKMETIARTSWIYFLMESRRGWCFCYCGWCCGWHVLKFHSNLLALANHIENVGYKPNGTSW